MKIGKSGFAPIACAILLSSASAAFGQTYAAADRSKEFFEMNEFTSAASMDEEVVQRDAQFTGGMKALQNYLTHHFNYPEVDRQNGVEGKVIVKFVIDEDGSVESARVLKSVSETIDSAVLLAIKTMPQWKPALRDGMPVKAYVTLPFQASLQ